MKILIRLIRHGMTAGNRTSSYIGRTDEPLTGEGAEAVQNKRKEMGPAAKLQNEKTLWIVSPMLRCLQTAALFASDINEADIADDPDHVKLILKRSVGNANLIIEPEMRECDFGAFEGKNYVELTGDADYQAWIDSNGTLAFPGGEVPSEFMDRCCNAFLTQMQRLAELKEEAPETVNIVVHGGTIMSILERFAMDEDGNSHAYYEWHVKNACGYEIEADIADLHALEKKKLIARKWG